jgi:hypothetical protein
MNEAIGYVRVSSDEQADSGLRGRLHEDRSAGRSLGLCHDEEGSPLSEGRARESCDPSLNEKMRCYFDSFCVSFRSEFLAMNSNTACVAGSSSEAIFIMMEP